MHRIVLPDLVRLLARVGARELGDPALPVALAQAQAEAGTALRDGVVRAEADATASVALHVFNATSDRDSGGVLGTRRRQAGARAAIDTRALLLKHDGEAWLRISLAAAADAVARGDLGGAAGRAGAARDATLSSYRRHAPATRCAEAIVRDLARFADARSVDDVLSLAMGDACAIQVEGTLSASLSLSWTAVLSAAASAAAEVAGRGPHPFLVEVPAAGGLALAVSITEGWSVAFARLQRDGDAAFRVAVRRQRRDERSAGATLAIDAGFEDPEAVANALEGALATVLDLPAQALRAIRDATSFQAIPARHRRFVAALAERFGLADSAPLEALRDCLQALDARLAGRFETLARTRAAVVLEAEYRRLADDALLLEADLSPAALARLHPALVGLDTAAVMADTGPGRAARSLLHDRTIERLQGWSIGASLGSWFELASSQRRQDRFLERRRVDASGDHVRHEYLGATRYTARANGWSTAHGATFEAVDDGRGAGRACALHLWWEEGRLRADAAGLARIVDDAVLWGLVDAHGAEALHARLSTALAGVGRCRPRFELELGDAATATALARIARTSPDAWASHLARALPWNARIAARATCATREASYRTVFAALGATQGAASSRQVAALLAGADPRLVDREGRGNAPWTAWRVLHQSGLADDGPGAACRAWAGAAGRLAAAAGNDAIGAAFADLRTAFEQPFTLRTVAGVLAAQAREARAVRLTVGFEHAGEARTLLVGA